MLVGVGVEEVMDSGSDTMKESKLEGLTMADCEQQTEKMKNQKETYIQAYITEDITHTLYLHVT